MLFFSPKHWWCRAAVVMETWRRKRPKRIQGESSSLKKKKSSKKKVRWANFIIKYFFKLIDHKTIKERINWDFLGGPVVSISPSRMSVWSLVRELSSHMPRGQNTKTQSRSNIVTNSIKTLKWSTSKKSLKKQVETTIMLACQSGLREITGHKSQ